MGDDYEDFINLLNQKMENNIKELDKKHKEFTELCKPLIKWLNDNHHPHTIIITTTTCELMEGLIAGEVLYFIKD